MNNRDKIQDLQQRLAEAEDALRAISAGEVDALVVDSVEGQKVFTLKSAETPYRAAIESINEGILTISSDGLIIYANGAIARMLEAPIERLVGISVFDFFGHESDLGAIIRSGTGKTELTLTSCSGRPISALVSATRLPAEDHESPAVILIVTDLSEIKRRDGIIAQGKLLAETQDLYRRIFATSVDGIWRLDNDFRILEVNPRMAEMLGYDADSLLGHLIFEYIPDNELEDARTRNANRRQGKSEVFERHLLRKDGSVLCTLVSATPIMDDIGTVTGSFGFFTDIAERKQYEERLRQSQAVAQQQLAEIQSIYDSAHIGLCVFDRDLRFVRINQYLAEINGLPAAEHIGKTPEEVVPSLAPAARATAESIFRTGSPVTDVEVSGITASQPGVVRHWLEQWKPLKASDGEIVGINVVVEEVTERKIAEQELRASEEKYRNLFSNMSEGFALFQIITGSNGEPIDYKIIEANPAWDEVTGLTAAHLLDKPLNQIFPEFEQFWLGKYGEVILNGRSLHLESYRQQAQKWLGISVYSPRKGYFVSLVQDVTTRKRAEAALTRSKENLELLVLERTKDLQSQFDITKKAEASLRALSARMLMIQEEERRSLAKELHDDVGQILTVVSIMLNSAEKASPQNLKPVLGEIRQHVTDALGKTRLISQSLRPQVLDDLGLELGLKSLFDGLKKQVGLTVEFGYEATCDINPSDNIAVYRIVQESLTNVLRHSGVKKADVRIWSEDNVLNVRIQDQGRGSEAELGRTSTGLSAMRERATLAGGSISFESAPGKGTTVTAKIPCHTDDLKAA